MTKLETLYKRELLPLQLKMHDECLTVSKQMKMIWTEFSDSFDNTFPTLTGTKFAYETIEKLITEDKKYIGLALQMQKLLSEYAEKVEDFANRNSISESQRKHLKKLLVSASPKKDT